MRRLFLFRPEPGASRTAGRARALGLQPAVVPLFKIEPVSWDAPDPERFDALLLTSANAMHFGGAGLQRLLGLPVHAVGPASARAAQEAGFAVAKTGDGGAERLLSGIDRDLRLLHICGEHRRALRTPDRTITDLVVYRSRALPFPVELRQIAGQVGAVHSPRAAERLAELLGGDVRGTVRLAAISAAAARSAGTGWEQIETAESPCDAALLECAARLCEKP